MDLRDKLDRLSPRSSRKGMGSRKKKTPPSSVKCEHIREIYTPNHKHGGLSVRSLGGRFRTASELLLPDGFRKPLDFGKIAFIDTETTGLGGSGVCAFLVGIGYLSHDGFVIEQFLMNDFPAEPDMLLKVCKKLEKFDVLSSYNGRTFDIPILDTRLLLNGIRKKLSERPHLDLLHSARRLWKHRLESCSLKSVEEHVLGHARKDDIDGWLIPQTFFEYLREGDRNLLEPILSHNLLDILSLACVAHVILCAVETPDESSLHHAADWYGLGTLFEQHRRTDGAVDCFERAIKLGLPGDTLDRCSRSLSLARKRGGQWDEAVRLWEEAAGSDDTEHIIFALEELAKFYEHRRHDLHSARETCRRAITMLEIKAATLNVGFEQSFENFDYRLRRIETKIRREGSA